MTPPTSGSLFDADPEKDGSLVQVLARGKPGNKAQQRFQRLVASIELKREQLKQWQAYSLRYNQRLTRELAPLQTQLRAGQRQMVLLIDELLTRPRQGRRLGRVQRSKLRDLLVFLLDGLLADSDDEALEALRDQYSESLDPQEGEVEKEFIKTFLTDVMGLEIDADQATSSTEELLEHARRKMEGRRVEEQAQQAPGRAYSCGTKGSKSSGAKAEAAQARREQAAKEVSQSLREVFRKLVSTLHPDRELDPEARQRKTLLMQRVNQAYEADDLLTLLGLQFEIEQIDTGHLSSLSAQRLGHYNQILREQLANLESELQRFIQPFLDTMGRHRGHALTVTDVDRQLSADIAQLRVTIRELRDDLVSFRDPVKLRESLKYFESEPPFDASIDMGELVDFFQPGRGRRGSRR
jgi:hypothetical protein